MTTLGNVGFSGYQILSSDMESSENVNLQGGKKNSTDADITFPISYSIPLFVTVNQVCNDDGLQTERHNTIALRLTTNGFSYHSWTVNGSVVWLSIGI